MGARLADFGGENFPDSKSDLFSMFVERCEDMCKTGGQMGFMSPFVWMFISSYEPMRRRLTENATITGLIQLEYSGFEGATVPICCFTVEMAALPNYMGAYIRLADFVGPQIQQPKALEAIQSPHVDWFYRASSNDFKYIPGRPIAYWLPPKLLEILRKQKTLQEISPPRQGIATADNARFLRLWWEVSGCRIGLGYHNELEAHESHRKWFPYNKGGEFRRWYGNQDFVINWQNGGEEIKNFVDSNGRQRSAIRNPKFQFRPAVSWSLISSGLPAFRYFPPGFLFDVAGMSLFGETEQEERQHLGLLNSVVATEVLKAYAPTMNFQVGDISRLPMPNGMLAESNDKVVMELVDLSKSDWDESEISWSFVGSPLLNSHAIISIAVDTYREKCVERVARMRDLEEMNNRHYLSSFGLEGEFPSDVSVARVSLDSNLAFRYRSSENVDLAQLGRAEEMRRFVSYVVGCAFGRYSLDQPGLILADQGSTLRDYLTKVSTPTFTPDDDNVIPIVDGDWFEDDIAGRFRRFLRVALGAKHFEENLNFVIESLGVKSLREYFITKAGKSKFYDDHVQRYKKRPIYWLFSSPKGSFNALIYLHRYTPSTASTVLTYLREYVTKLESSLQHAERAGNAKEADRLRKILVELNEYEHDTLYPKASENVAIDLDDGVKVNYPKLGGALRKIAGLESSGD
jgi:hypothetical protein